MADTVTRYETAQSIMATCAASVGLTPPADIFNSAEATWIQMTYLFNLAGQHLVMENAWQRTKKDWAITTDDTVTTPLQSEGKYDLPADFAYLINNTGWDTTNDLPLGGALTDMQFTHLVGIDQTDNTFNVNFQINDNQLWLYPQPPANGIVIKFRYVSRLWLEVVSGTDYADRMTSGANVCMLDALTLISRLKYEWLNAKGFPSSVAKKDAENTFNLITGRDSGAQIISLSRGRQGIHFLDARNFSDTGFGS